MEKEEINKENNTEELDNSTGDQSDESSKISEEEKILSPEDKIKDLEDKMARTLAEMENQRRRFEKEKEEAFEFGGFNFARESLSLLDNIDRAIISFQNDENLKDNKDLNKIIDSIDIIKKDLISIFKKNGIEPIECLNKKFDPNFHQGMLEIENDTKEPGIVIQEIQKVYMMKDRLLRPSLVGVTKKPPKKEDKK